MYKIEEIRTDMINAMKSQDKERKDALSYLLSLLKNAEIEKRDHLTDEEVGKVVLKYLKQLEDTKETIPSDRADLFIKNQKETEIIKEYAPVLLDKVAIRHFVVAALEELKINNPMKNDKGRIMKILMPKIKGKADGRVVNEVLDEYLK